MRIAHPKDDLAASQSGQFAALAVVKGFGKFLERCQAHGSIRRIGKIGGILGRPASVVNEKVGDMQPRGVLYLAVLWSITLPGLVSAASVEVAAGMNLPFCQEVAKFFGERLEPAAELIKTVDWKPVDLKGQGPKTRQCSSIDRAIIDLDNSGTKDLVVRTTFCMKGAPSDSLYVFPADSSVLERSSWQDLGPLLATDDRFERTGGTYPLVSLPLEPGLTSPVLTTMFVVLPFILDSVAYVALTDTKREWLVIAKYRDGQRFEDQCYLRAGKP